jgi:hypothetical protein
VTISPVGILPAEMVQKGIRSSMKFLSFVVQKMNNRNILKMSVKKILIILCICSMPLFSHADQTTFSFLAGTTLNFGIAIKQLDFDVSDSDESDFNGTLTEGMYAMGSHLKY